MLRLHDVVSFLVGGGGVLVEHYDDRAPSQVAHLADDKTHVARRNLQLALDRVAVLL